MAAGLIDDMMRDLMQKLFVSSATNYVAEEGPKDTDLNLLLQEVVDPRIEEMPGDIIPLLDSYISAVQDASDSQVEVLQLLLLLKNYIVDKASEKLPISMKVLQNLLDAQRDDRLPLYEALKDESMEGVSMESIVVSCINLIQAVEEEKMIPDMNLLSKLCIIREELFQVYAYSESEAEGRPLRNPFLSFQSVPQRDAAIVKELINVSSKPKRVAIIKSKIVNEDGSKGEIRPGQFLDCIQALQQEMMIDEQGRTNTQVQDRLDDIRQETVHVLEEISGEVPLRP